MRGPSTALVLAILMPGLAGAQEISVSEVHRLDGPRVGVSWLGGVSRAELDRDHGVGRLMTEFGWQYEQLVMPRPGAINLVVKQVVSLGGLDQGTILPSITGQIGLRHPAGLEFGVGPAVSRWGVGLAWTAGWNVRYGTVTLPFTVTLTRNGAATRVTVLGGFAIETLRRAGARIHGH